jgi:hypothetical protein
LRPYQGLLLLFEAEEIMKNLLPDPSSLLVRFIQIVTPNTSFEQLQTILDCSLSQIYRMAAHLHFWGQGRIIQSKLNLSLVIILLAISTRNFYVISDEADFTHLHDIVDDFGERFAPLDLPTILHEISLPRPYHTIIPNKESRQLYLEAIAYLLRYLKLFYFYNLFIGITLWFNFLCFFSYSYPKTYMQR